MGSGAVLGKAAGNDDRRLFGLPIRTALIVALSVMWFLFVLLFVIGIMAIVGVFGNANTKVIEFMDCDSQNNDVSCSRVYGYRAEGVVLIILAFFALGWAVILTFAFIMARTRTGSNPPQGGLTFTSVPARKAQFATSQA